MFRSILSAIAAITAALTLCQCSSSGIASSSTYKPRAGGQVDNAKSYLVKTTAYSHLEGDSLQYGKGNAAGGDLKFGLVRSAAADWSCFPLGTVFKIDGMPYIYTIDDYGSALVGTKTIDLYKPTMAGISDWGARNVKIKVLKWGSYERSMAVLKGRLAHAHVRAMYSGIQKKIGKAG